MKTLWEHLGERFPEYKEGFLRAGEALQKDVAAFMRDGSKMCVRLRSGEVLEMFHVEQVYLPQWVSVIRPTSEGVPAARQAVDYREGQPSVNIEKQRDPYTGLG
jgi:hypothetical protein